MRRDMKNIDIVYFNLINFNHTVTIRTCYETFDYINVFVFIRVSVAAEQDARRNNLSRKNRMGFLTETIY